MKNFFLSAITISVLCAIFFFNPYLLRQEKTINKDLHEEGLFFSDSKWEIINKTTNSHYLILSSEAKNILKLNQFLLSRPLIKIKEQGALTNEIQASLGNLNTVNKKINLHGGVTYRNLQENNFYKIISEEINLDISKDLIFSKQHVSFKGDNFSIEAKGFLIDNSKIEDNQIKITFNEAKIYEANIGKERKELGRAGVVYLFPNSRYLILKDNAEISQEDIKIRAKQIKYDLNKKEILNSKKSKTIIKI